MGSYFSYTNNVVLFNEIDAEVVSSSDTSLFVIVPDCINDENPIVSVSVIGNKVFSPLNFELIFPEIFEFYPESGNNSEIIEIYGEGFQSDKAEIIFGQNVIATILESTSTYLKVQLPQNIKESGINPIRYTNGCQEVRSSNEFTLEGVLVSNVSVKEAIIGRDILVLSGSGFSDIPHNNLIIINDLVYDNLDILESSNDQISFSLPGNAPVGDIRLTVNVADKTFNSPILINSITPWIQKEPFPGGSPGSNVGEFGSSFVIGNSIYFINSYSVDDVDFWEYSTNEENWLQKNDLPIHIRRSSVAFSLNGKGYIGTGSTCTKPLCSVGFFGTQTFFSYDPVEDSWSELGEVASLDAYYYGVYGAIGFHDKNYGYIFGGVAPNGIVFRTSTNKYYRFDPISNSWEEYGIFSEFSEYLLHPAGFKINNEFYFGGGQVNTAEKYNSNFWKFNPLTNSWDDIAEFPGTPRKGAVGFSKDGFGYIGLGFNENHGKLKDFWKYDPSQNQWRRVADLPASAREGAISAEVNGRAFIGFGTEENDLWEFQ
jgi:N-acetylneuraminic acid mutarotase